MVYPRFTRAVAPKFKTEKMHPNEAYEIIRNNEDRDKLILEDVKNVSAKAELLLYSQNILTMRKNFITSLKTTLTMCF